MNEPPKGLSIQERVKWRMERDATCIKDAENFKARFGEYPQGMGRKKTRSSKSNLEFNPNVKVKHAQEIKHADRVMVAKNEFHQGRAVWYFEVGAWACRSADDCLSFLLKK